MYEIVLRDLHSYETSLAVLFHISACLSAFYKIELGAFVNIVASSGIGMANSKQLLRTGPHKSNAVYSGATV